MPPSHPPYIALALLGPFHATDGDAAIHGFRSDKARALLVYLAVEADRPHRREALAALLWPDQPDALAFQNLRQSLARLRRALNDSARPMPLLHATATTIHFDSAANVDVLRFAAWMRQVEQHQHTRADACAACAAWRTEAVAVYRGDFLVGLALPESEPFETWAQTLREQLHRQAVDSCAALAAYHEQHTPEEATRYAAWTLVLEPWHEASYRTVMRVLAQGGRTLPPWRSTHAASAWCSTSSILVANPLQQLPHVAA